VGSQIPKPQLGFELRKPLNAVEYCEPVSVQNRSRESPVHSNNAGMVTLFGFQ